MPVVTLFQSDRDPTRTFETKKDAEAHDRKLLLAEVVTGWLQQQVPALGRDHATQLGNAVAAHRDDLLIALKGNVEALITGAGASSSPPAPAANDARRPAAPAKPKAKTARK